MQSTELDGKVALVTGAANGIGAAVSRRLASQGASVVAADVDDEAGEAVAAEVGGLYVHLDVRDLAQNEAAVAAAVDRFGGLDLVHLNAGVSSGHGLGADFDEAAYRRAMGINLDGVVYGVHAALPALQQRGGGTIIATASMAGLTPVALDPIYAANKAAVVALVRSLAEAYRADGILVNALCPSFAHTNIITGIKAFLDEVHFPILDVSEVVDAFVAILDGGGTGEAWFVVPGRESQPFGFRNVPGPRSTEPH
ncbi:SDR family NAD(P)-dependent oxidoreductase [Aquihabitans sp. G128]|uniref:SDR family oxidoreductase n=1 Tax=Aquihabitans sp. G128 TaxID=2849779 RepID=UPI001C246944|nr:SDR family NAD(P)-dependent oxidoreductase [Aquihabitans sp. G128]QXC63375.1 SDR family NAD(P)-dependent oxidoreductase [Aquihabitans sp. G128]